MKRKKPKKLWAFWANINGPWYYEPQQVYWDDFNERWWHEDGNSDVKKMGLELKEHYLSYSSVNKKEVQDFINGFMGCRHLLSEFFKNYEDE